tara:strand:+ start:2542 stop:3036 length:495 start_codon:yes stop_codon:yes gene_type:complete
MNKFNTIKKLKSENNLLRNENGRIMPLILKGRAGCGKSVLAKSLFSSEDSIITVNSPVTSALDLVKHSSLMTVSIDLSALYAENIGEQYGAVIFDEAQSTNYEMHSVLLELMQFGLIDGNTLGKNVMIILLATPKPEETETNSLPMAITSRAIIIDVENDLTEG